VRVFESIDEEGKPYRRVYETSPGRMLISGQLLPRHGKITFDLINQTLTPIKISLKLLILSIVIADQKHTVIFADHLMGLGFRYASKSGISFGKDDLGDSCCEK
jgi:DNA-directed RNA polymerase subunit beta'